MSLRKSAGPQFNEWNRAKRARSPASEEATFVNCGRPLFASYLDDAIATNLISLRFGPRSGGLQFCIEDVE
jgi:hypothetical protein